MNPNRPGEPEGAVPPGHRHVPGSVPAGEPDGVLNELVTMMRAQAMSIADLQRIVGTDDGRGQYSAEVLRGHVAQPSLWARIGNLWNRVKSLEADKDVLRARAVSESRTESRRMVDAAMVQINGQLARIDSALQAVREEVQQTARRVDDLDRDWRNLRAERVRNEETLSREQHAAHHDLAAELVRLGTQHLRKISRHLRPPDAGDDNDLTRFRADRVRRAIAACLRGPVVDQHAVQCALYEDAAPRATGDTEHKEVRRLLEAADRFRAKVELTRVEPQFDFDLPGTDDEYDVWHPCIAGAPPTFVVVPTYRVGSRRYNRPVVFTTLPEPTPDLVLPTKSEAGNRNQRPVDDPDPVAVGGPGAGTAETSD